MRLPDLNKGEKIILISQGTLNFKSLHQQGYFFLTNTRLIFNHVTKTTFQTSLKDIIKVSIEKKSWFFGINLRQIGIDFNSEYNQKQIYMVLAEPITWSEKIKEGMALMLAEGWGYHGTNTKPSGNA